MRFMKACFAVVLFCGTAVGLADETQPPITSLPAVAHGVLDALQERSFAKAVELIDAELKQEKVTAPDYLLYLKGRAQTELEQFDAARATYDLLEEKHKESRWTARSRFGRADILVRKHDYRAASDLYRAEAERLLSDGRRDELTGIYLEFADRYFEGVPAADPSARKQPDYGQALTYYAEALTLKPSRAKQHVIELRIARCKQEMGNHGEAIGDLDRFLTNYGVQATESRRAKPELLVEARYELGRSHLAAGQPVEARKAWQALLSMKAEGDVGADRRKEAAFLIAHTYGVPEPGSVKDLELGVAAHEKFLAAHPDDKRAPLAEYEIAQSYLKHQRHEQAVARLKKLLDNPAYAKADQIPQARFLLGQSYAAQCKFDEAIAAWRDFLDKHPSDSNWSNVQRAIINVEYEMANDKRKSRDYAAARNLWQTFLNKYPLDARAAKVLFAFGAMKYDAATDQQQAHAKDPDAPETVDGQPLADVFQAAIDDWRRLVEKYPGNNEASHASYMIGVTLEDQLGKPAEALEAYKKVQGQYQRAAALRIDRLTAKQLEVVTERKFRSGEKPVLKVSTRNVEKVSLRTYRIDMVDYFRKMHLATGVEQLDIALIDPDKSWDYSVPKYEAFRRLENEVEIPIDGPGITAVTVATDTLEATTMVVVSDIDVIVKSSRNELFVFAENVPTGKPADGVTLLVSDGETVFAEATTNAEGILQQSFEELATVEDLRVFAIKDGHVASTVTNLDGLDFAMGLSAKGYLYTDRTAYRAGELVNLRGLVRWVENDRYHFAEGEKYRLDVYDARGRAIHNGDVALNAFGSFATQFIVPNGSPQGTYRVHLFQPGKSQSYESTFEVHSTSLEPVRIQVDLAQHVFYRGDKITGTIKLGYYYGTPLPGRAIEYRLADGRVFNATTDSNGEVKFEFETEQFSESQPLPIWVRFAERSLEANSTVYLATRGFEIDVKALRDAYLAGETFDVTATLNDPEGKPVAANVVLEVLEQTQVRGERGERLVEKFDDKSNTDKGEVRRTLRIDKAGKYIVRATATDRFGASISGSYAVVISGDDDTVRLRILADKHHYNVGETAGVQLHWREKPALALITYEGEKILGHQLVELKTGSNPIEVPLDGSLAPNFNLAVAVIEGHRFHQAQSEFRVSRKLQIRIEPKTTTPKPGEDLEVKVTVTDAQGKPVSAEVSLALVQQNLLDAFPEEHDAIEAFFGGGYREPSIRAATSGTFRYQPTTKSISETVLAEAERTRLLREELSNLAAASGRYFPPRLGGQKPASGQSNNSGNGQAEMDSDGLNETLSDRMSGEDAPSDREWEAMDESESKKMDDSGYPSYALPQDGGGIGGGGLGGGGGVGGGFVDPFRARKDGDQRGDVKLNLIIRQHQSISGDDKSSDGPAGGELRTHTIRNGNFPAIVPMESGSLSSDFTQPTQEMLFGLSKSRDPYLALNRLGEMQVVNGRSVDVLARVAEGGLKLLPGAALAETGYWNPALVTNAEGVAVVTFRLPERSTAWKLSSKGIDKGAIVGESSVDIVTKKDLFGDLKTPLAFTSGDKADLLVEVHNTTVAKGSPIEVVLQTTIGEKSTKVSRTLTSEGPGMQEVAIPIEITAGSNVQFELSVSSGELKDVQEQSVAIQPYGISVFATAGGTAGQSTIAFVQHDKALPVSESHLEILIGPSVNRTLLDTVLGDGFTPLAASHRIAPHNPLERAVSDALGGVALLQLVGGSKNADTPEAQLLSGRVQSAVSQLVAAQRDDGGWSWSGDATKKSDHFISSRVVWALSVARAAGFAVPEQTFNTSVAYLNSAFVALGESNREDEAIVLHGLAQAGRADFAYANRLYRERNRLSPSGLLHVALVLAKLDRKEMAGELLKLVKLPLDPKLANNPSADTVARTCIPWMQAGVELRALYLLALEEIDPNHAEAEKTAEWLMSARTGNRWLPEKANGPVIAALSQWNARTKHENEKYTLSVFVNDKLVEKLEIDPARDGSRRVAVPDRMLVADAQQRINFDLQGRGKFSYSAVLSGFVAADKLKATTNSWRVVRTYEPAKMMLDGQEIPRGFDILTGSYNTFKNPLTQLAVGHRGEVTLSLWRQDVRGVAGEKFDYLVITEPIPAGTMVLADSVQGPFERYEITPGAITFYVGDQPYIGEIRYTLAGYLPGEFRTTPTVVRSFYRPDQIAVAEAKSLAVLARDGKSADEYKLTPMELLELGKRLVDKREFAQAHGHLTQLFNNFQLNDSAYQTAAQLLFRTSLEVGQNDEIVRYFEIIKEKYPDVEVDFTSILRVASAYRELGEYERGYLVYRATIEASFERESQIAGFLAKRGEFLRSVEVMERILADYPAEAYVATTTYALAQEVYGKGPEAKDDPKLREAKIGRVPLIGAAVRMLDHFVATWPLDPAADQASFSQAVALIDLEQYDMAVTRCEKFAARYPESKLLDSYWYVTAFSQFALGKHDEALAMCLKVAETTRRDPQTGIDVEAANKWQAIYIMGQIYHSLNKPADAIAQYEKVKDRFADALEAIEYFTSKSIKLDEVTIVKPGEQAKLPLDFRNVPSANVKVYRIDLMKFGLLQRNLDRITAINLAGIQPYHEANLQLGDGKDYADRKQEVNLPLTEEGAYLVVCRGENLYASSLVLVSPLELAVQEDATAGRVRVTVKDARAGHFAHKVHVKVIGSQNDKFIDGETDLRGIFVADAILGTSTVIARIDENEYAFYRGKTPLGQVAPVAPATSAPAPNEAAMQQAPVNGPMDSRQQLLQNVIDGNSAIQSEQRGNYRDLLDNGVKGVKAKAAY